MTFKTLPRANGGANENTANVFTTMNGTFPKTSGVPLLSEVSLTSPGAPIRNPASSQRIGSQLRGVSLFQDTNLLELIQYLDRERIPER